MTRTNHSRWKDEASFSPLWDSRTALIAKLIEPGSSVLEFGAGKRRLEALLPPGCTYTPSDLFPRSDDTLVLDLNGSTLGTLPLHDVAVLSGVLEYVEDIPRLARALADCVHGVFASYAVTDRNPIFRVESGWLNHFSTSEIEAHFGEAGFACTEKGAWGPQVIFTFRRDPGGATQ